MVWARDSNWKIGPNFAFWGPIGDHSHAPDSDFSLRHPVVPRNCSPRIQPMFMASPGIGTPNHLSGELFNMMAGVKMIHVPYRGTGPALTDLLGGQVENAFGRMPVERS
jgi:hypothetical protein